MNLRDALSKALDHVEEWSYEDRGYDYSICHSCGWDTKEDRTAEVPMGHRPGCELRAALDVLEAYLAAGKKPGSGEST
jgi:hypothetical protein